ncbi:MAG: protein kinase domain-containing protein [Acidobacteriota bacterium]
MPLAIGARLGPYEVVGPLGAGGMGEVYRARDTKLNRDVALKILPDAFAGDPNSLQRFTREAQTLAALNHANIAHIHGLEESVPSTGSGQVAVRALVMELVEGEDLARRLARGPIPLAEALPIARQIAEALEAAHELDIVHRDLKPANIKVRDDGTVKVLDFGLAKALDSATGGSRGPDPSQSPTVAGVSMAGAIVGTAAYMAPEQAKGRPVNRRADIFAFGCVLFEMLAGRRAFEGDDVAEILSRVLQSEPDWTRLPRDTPPRIRELLRLCLEKNPKQRRSDSADVRIDLERAIKPSESAVSAPTSASGARAAWIAVTVMAPAFAALVVWQMWRQPAEPVEMRLDIATPPTTAPLQFELSPDGMSLVYVAFSGDQLHLWVRRLDKDSAQPLTGTAGAEDPFWSGDGRSIGFFAGGKLKRIDLAGGQAQILADAPTPRGGTWNVAGTIVYAPFNGSLRRIAATGGEAAEATTLLDGQVNHRFPQFLPDGRHFLFQSSRPPEANGVFLGSLDGTPPKWLTASDTFGAYLGPDRVLFMRQGALRARRLDLTRGELVGDPEVLADGVAFDPSAMVGGFSTSSNGRFAYRGGAISRRHLTWFDRSGNIVGHVGEPDVETLRGLDLSPDGRRVVVDRTVLANRDVWLIDRTTGGLTRFTFDPAVDGYPVWSPDGSQIVFETNRRGDYDLYVKPAGGAAERALLEAPRNQWPLGWSHDGRFLLYHDAANSGDLWALPMTGADRTPIAVATTAFVESDGALSPDGRWVGYQTNESGRFQIVVQPFPNATWKRQVSTRGAVSPRWSADGRELYYLALDGMLNAVAIKETETDLQAGLPLPLFQTRLVAASGTGIRKEYAVAPDGRFLVNRPVDENSASPITLVLNWKPTVK